MNSRLRRVAVTALKRIRRPLRRRTTPHGLVLMYHRVARPLTDPWTLSVSPENFRDHLAVLTRQVQIVPLTELPQRLSRARSNERPAVAITFDDGYVDNLEEALPILQQFAAPATVFIATSWIGKTEPFWWDALAAMVLGPQPLHEPIDVQLGAARFKWEPCRSTSERGRQALHRSLWAHLQVLDDPQRFRALQQIADCYGGTGLLDRAARPMTVAEVRRLHASNLVEIGSHTAKHRPLPTLPPELQREEICNSRLQCEQWTGISPASFSYPYGEFDEHTPAMVAGAGYALACSTETELVWPETSPYLLPRFVVLDWSAARFERQLRQVWLP
jgi:peptidoglycan/xylan/chitin deacetylase (PgdA/CDA1 family)